MSEKMLTPTNPHHATSGVPSAYKTELVLVLPQNQLKKRPQNWVKSFRMNNFLVIVLDKAIRIITLQKQWGGVPHRAEGVK